MTAGYTHIDTRQYRVVQAAPALEPVTREEAKLWLRVSHIQEDLLIDSLIMSARIWCENYTHRAFVNRSCVLYVDGFPYEYPYNQILLPLGAVQSITNIKYVALGDAISTLTTLAASQYQTDLISEPARVLPAALTYWPIVQWGTPNVVQITYVAGYGAAATSVPEALKTAIKMLLANAYKNREPITETNVNEVPLAMKALIDPYRIVEFF